MTDEEIADTAKGVLSVASLAVGGEFLVAKALPKLATALGPAGRVFGNTFYAGRQGFLNHGYMRLGWSYNQKTGLLEFAFRIGKDHFPFFTKIPP